VLDNLERALEAANNAKDVDSVRMGVEFIAQQFREVLRGHGVEVIEAQGKAFDPAHHEALEEISGTEHPEGTVAHEVQRGYKFNGRVLRPSRVRVAGSR
jgi:molecular chaperone GrpE